MESPKPEAITSCRPELSHSENKKPAAMLRAFIFICKILYGTLNPIDCVFESPPEAPVTVIE